MPEALLLAIIPVLELPLLWSLLFAAAACVLLDAYKRATLASCCCTLLGLPPKLLPLTWPPLDVGLAPVPPADVFKRLFCDTSVDWYI